MPPIDFRGVSGGSNILQTHPLQRGTPNNVDHGASHEQVLGAYTELQKTQFLSCGSPRLTSLSSVQILPRSTNRMKILHLRGAHVDQIALAMRLAIDALKKPC